MVATGVTPLLVDLESMTAKPRASGGSKYGVAMIFEMTVHYFVHTYKVTTDSSMG